MSENTNTEIIQFDEISSIMAGAGAVLESNTKLSEKAKNGLQSLIDTADAEGMSDALDKQMNDKLVIAKETFEFLQKKRTPITQMANKVVSIFTSLEEPVNPQKKGNLFDKVKDKRNLWAAEVALVAREKEEKVRLEQAKKSEKVELSGKIELAFRAAYNAKLYEFQNWYNNKFNSSTLETIEKHHGIFKTMNTIYPRDKFNELSIDITAIHHTKEEISVLIFDTRTSLYDELSKDFTEKMSDLRNDLISKIPSKKTELIEIAAAGEKEKQKLLDKQKERELAEQLERQKELDDQKLKDEEAVKLKQNIGVTNSLFDANKEIAQLNTNSATVRTGYNITVKDSAGWGAIFLLYFDKEGMNLTVEDFGKKTMNQMKTFCEKFAHKTGEKIVSDCLTYTEDFKAVTKADK